MCDRASVTPEPESRDTGAREMESGDSTKYGIVSDINIDDSNDMRSHSILSELHFEDGEWSVRGPGASDQGDVTPGSTQERLLVTTAPVTLSGGDGTMTMEHQARIAVADPQSLVLDQTLLNREWPELELGTLNTEPGAGDHGVTSNVTHSSSLSSYGQVTPPRHEPFELDSRPNVYLQGLNQSNQEAFAHLNDVNTDPGDQAEITVDNQIHDDNSDNQAKRKPRGPSKRIEKKKEVQARKEEKKRKFDIAIEAWKNHEFENIHACANHFGVCHKSLKKMILEGRSYVGGGKQSYILTVEEEAKIVDHIKWCKSVGFGLTYYILQLLIQELLNAVVG